MFCFVLLDSFLILSFLYFAFQDSSLSLPQASEVQSSNSGILGRVKLPSPKLRSHLIHRQHRLGTPKLALARLSYHEKRSSFDHNNNDSTDSSPSTHLKPPRHVRSNSGPHYFTPTVSIQNSSDTTKSPNESETYNDLGDKVERRSRSKSRSLMKAIRSRSKSLSKSFRVSRNKASPVGATNTDGENIPAAGVVRDEKSKVSHAREVDNSDATNSRRIAPAASSRRDYTHSNSESLCSKTVLVKLENHAPDNISFDYDSSSGSMFYPKDFKTNSTSLSSHRHLEFSSCIFQKISSSHACVRCSYSNQECPETTDPHCNNVYRDNGRLSLKLSPTLPHSTRHKAYRLVTVNRRYSQTF